jgi:ribosome-associated protein
VTIEVTVRGLTIPPEELSWRFSRSSGPGGQSVNTTDSQVELSYDLAGTAALPPVLRDRALAALAGRLSGGGVISVVASEYKSQLRNREAAAARLSAVLTEATAPPRPPRRPTRPTRGSVERRLADKQRRSQLKRQRRSDDE